MLVYQFKTVAYFQTIRFIVHSFNDCKKVAWFRFKFVIFWSIYWSNLTTRSITVLNLSVNKIWNSSQKWSCSLINKNFSFWNIISRTKLFVRQISSFCIDRDSFASMSQYRSSIRQMKMFEIENDNNDNLHFFMTFDRILHFNFSSNNRNIFLKKILFVVKFFWTFDINAIDTDDCKNALNICFNFFWIFFNFKKKSFFENVFFLTKHFEKTWVEQKKLK